VVAWKGIAMNESAPDLTVIIVSWNVCRLLNDCLYSVEAAMKSLNAEIYVVDNASHDGSVQMVAEKYPGVHLIANQENLGFGRANNQVLRLCQTKYALLLNPDTLVHPNTFEMMLSFMEAHPRAGLAGPEQRDGNGTLIFSYLVSWSPREFIEHWIERLASFGQRRTRLLYTQPRRVPILSAGCWILRQAALAETGLFDEEMFLYNEEYDMCTRMRRAGWEIWFLRDVEIIHYRRQSMRQCSPLQEANYYLHSMSIWLKKRYKHQPGV
jgi:GT2 family glycosyltransferase